MVTIHGYLVSTWTRTICMACIEKGVDYELVPLAYGSEAHRRMHPFGKMPVVQTGSGQMLRRCGANKTVREVFALVGIAPQFEQFEDVNTAVGSFL